jgi:hypothetical protein
VEAEKLPRPLFVRFCAPNDPQNADKGSAGLRPGGTAEAAVSTWFVPVFRVEVFSGDAQCDSCLCKKSTFSLSLSAK